MFKAGTVVRLCHLDKQPKVRLLCDYNHEDADPVLAYVHLEQVAAEPWPRHMERVTLSARNSPALQLCHVTGEFGEAMAEEEEEEEEEGVIYPPCFNTPTYEADSVTAALRCRKYRGAAQMLLVQAFFASTDPWSLLEMIQQAFYPGGHHERLPVAYRELVRWGKFVATSHHGYNTVPLPAIYAIIDALPHAGNVKLVDSQYDPFVVASEMSPWIKYEKTLPNLAHRHVPSDVYSPHLSTTTTTTQSASRYYLKPGKFAMLFPRVADTMASELSWDVNHAADASFVEPVLVTKRVPTDIPGVELLLPARTYRFVGDATAQRRQYKALYFLLNTPSKMLLGERIQQLEQVVEAAAVELASNHHPGVQQCIMGCEVAEIMTKAKMGQESPLHIYVTDMDAQVAVCVAKSEMLRFVFEDKDVTDFETHHRHAEWVPVTWGQAQMPVLLRAGAEKQAVCVVRQARTPDGRCVLSIDLAGQLWCNEEKVDHGQVLDVAIASASKNVVHFYALLLRKGSTTEICVCKGIVVDSTMTTLATATATPVTSSYHNNTGGRVSCNGQYVALDNGMVYDIQANRRWQVLPGHVAAVANDGRVYTCLDRCGTAYPLMSILCQGPGGGDDEWVPHPGGHPYNWHVDSTTGRLQGPGYALHDRLFVTPSIVPHASHTPGQPVDIHQESVVIYDRDQVMCVEGEGVCASEAQLACGVPRSKVLLGLVRSADTFDPIFHNGESFASLSSLLGRADLSDCVSLLHSVHHLFNAPVPERFCVPFAQACREQNAFSAHLLSALSSSTSGKTLNVGACHLRSMLPNPIMY